MQNNGWETCQGSLSESGPAANWGHWAPCLERGKSPYWYCTLRCIPENGILPFLSMLFVCFYLYTCRYYHNSNMQWFCCAVKQITILQSDSKNRGSQNKTLWLEIWTLDINSSWVYSLLTYCIYSSSYLMAEIRLHSYSNGLACRGQLLLNWEICVHVIRSILNCTIWCGTDSNYGDFLTYNKQNFREWLIWCSLLFKD